MSLKLSHSILLSFCTNIQISQIVREHDRFVPLHAFDDEDDASSAPSTEDFIVNIGDLDDDDSVVAFDNSPSAYEESLERMQQLQEKYRRSEKDTGSAEFQIAGMTERIAYLTKHMQENPKDFSTRRGLVALVNKRRRLLNFLVKDDASRYEEMISSLGIRHKPPGRVPDRAETYGRFPRQKAVKKHLVRKKK
jgi:small subunit ribosomal protein S15